MATIEQNLQTIKDSFAAIKNAILSKNGVVKGNITTYAEGIINLQTGDITNPTASKNDVTFYDYDGTIRYSYTAEEFLALTEMPPLPTQPGLICQEWNWSFAKAQEYVAEYRILNIGATYTTYDGKTRLYIKVESYKPTVITFGISMEGGGMIIDYGDGNTITYDQAASYLYKLYKAGEYCITITVPQNCSVTLRDIGFMSSTDDYKTFIQKVEIGERFNIGNNAFEDCYSLKSITLPLGASIGNSFNRCYSLKSTIIPSNITSIPSNAFTACYSLNSVITSQSTFNIDSYAFDACKSLKSITIPADTTSISYHSISNCELLDYVVIPKSVIKINSYAFYYSSNVKFYDFSHHTAVPTLTDTNAFQGIPSDCKIIVPDNLYDTWIAATNWSEYTRNIIKKSNWNN
jgi:hypothetical protein